MVRGQCQLLTSQAVTVVFYGQSLLSMHCSEVNPIQKPLLCPTGTEGYVTFMSEPCSAGISQICLWDQPELQLSTEKTGFSLDSTCSLHTCKVC